MINQVEISYPLSPTQHGMLAHSLHDEEGGTYIQQAICLMRESIDLALLVSAWRQLIKRHAVLRTSFRWEAEGPPLPGPIQEVHREPELDFISDDWSSCAAEVQQQRLDNFLESDSQRGFSPDALSLMRVSVFKLGDCDYRMVWTFHDALFDGRSYFLLLRELFDRYEALCAGWKLHLEQPRPYHEYIKWLAEQDLTKAELFWRDSLSGFTAPTSLRVAEPRNADRRVGQRHATSEIRLSEKLTAGLRLCAEQTGVTLNTLLQASWALLLSRYSGETEVLFGVTRACRHWTASGAESMVGLFINTLPFRVSVRAEQHLTAWLQELRALHLAHRDYEHTPLIKIKEWSAVPRGVSLFDSVLVFENSQWSNRLQELGGNWNRRDVEFVERSNYALTLSVYADRDLVLKLEYDQQQFDRETIDRMLRQLETVHEGIAENADRQLGELPFLTGAERRQLLTDWNQPTPCASHQSLPQLFEQQVNRTPDAVALVVENERITYRELNQRANQLAHHLRRRGVGPDELVALCFERSLEMIVCVLGTLKAGGAYVPMDPAYPAERLSFMLADAGARVLLTVECLREKLPAHGLEVVCLDSDWETITSESPANPRTSLTPENLAYVIYTSGSTGQPKGVQIEHRALANLLTSMRNQPGLNSTDVLLAVTTLSFDIAGLEIYLPLISGGQLVVANREVASDGSLLKEKLFTCGATVMQATPATWRMLIDAGWKGNQNLKVLCGGEALPRELAKELLERCGELWNMYGPTETTIWSTITRIDAKNELVSIGRPIANTQVYLLDNNRQLAPLGVAGELCIGGDGLARGYLKQPELTAQKFIPNPFAESERIYRTGDLARYLPDGQIECLGRVDNQVKIRGHRIEIAEIESVLAAHPEVRQCVVMALDDPSAGKRLVAYVVRDNEDVSTTVLRAFLKERLPNYMMPSAFVALAQLPLTPNGKIDRRALPEPEINLEERETFVGPRTPVEKVLAGIWQEVLKTQNIGTDDDFFALGGHSLLAAQVISRVLQRFQVQLTLRALFEAPTLSGLAARIETTQIEAPSALPAIKPLSRLLTQGKRKLFQIKSPLRALFELPTGAARAERVEATPRDEEKRQRPLSKGGRDGHLPLSFTQQRLWFLDQLRPDSRFYNMQFGFRLRGALNTDALQRSLNEIVRRHETLRTSFAVSEGQPMQVIAPPLPLKLSVEDLRGLPESDREGEVQRLAAEQAERRFDLTQAPLLRVGLWQVGNDDYVLLLVMHHIASDGWSIGILFGELAALYRSYCLGHVSPLADLPIQFADYALWQRQWLQGEVLERQLAYWREHLAGAPAVLELPTDRPRPAVATYNGGHRWVGLPPELTAQLKALAQGEGATLNMVILAAFQVLLSRYSGQEDILVGSPIANRTRAEIEGLIGFFVNTLVLRTDLSGNPTFRELLGRVREVALDAYSHQDVPFEKLVEELNPERSLSHTPLFQVMFAVQNMPESSLTLPGLELQNFSLDRKTSEFDLTLYIGESVKGLTVTFEYNTDLFAENTIARMLRHFEVFLQGIVATPDQRISELPLLTDSERQQLLVKWNDTQAEFPLKKCPHVLFEEQVERTPHSPAVVFDDQQLTYAELNSRTNQLAHYLRKRGVGPDAIVGLFCERSLEMTIAVLGILKAGAAYLPLDASYPSDRLSFMLQDATVNVLLTQEQLRERLSGHGAEMICLDSEWEAIALESDKNSQNNTSTENLAYVIYTSGSSGQPKGVAMTQESLTNLISWQLERAAGLPPAKTLQFASLSFDVSFQEMFSTWGSGGTLVLVSEELRRDAPALLSFLKNRAIERVFMPFVYLQHLAEIFEQRRPGLMALREVISAGEQLELTPQMVKFFGALKGVLLYNHYGPSETHVVTAHQLPDLPEQWPALAPIGRPISNTQIYIVDRNLEPVPIGVSGELCIGGASLARGYLNRPGLTAATFLPDPFSAQPGARIYVTGDLARYREDNTIEFLGRIDGQVKIRGFRVEPGEIEIMLAAHPSVRDVVVVTRGEKKGDRRLVGYVVAVAGNREGLASELRSYLTERLPDYMIPSSLVLLDELPLTPNGKVDRHALPTPYPLQSELSGRFVAARTDTEIMLGQIWERLLKVHPVGVKDNFFDLGGHSLLATRLVSDIKKISGKTLPLTSLFQRATIEYLAGILDNDSGSASWSTLVEIQSGSKWPFFCVTPPNVGALGYFGLARHMDPNQSVYGLQGQSDRKIEGEHDQVALQNLARDYIRAMRQVQPEGPYLLGGMCLGAHIAFEMARQLEAESQKVSLLAIFDTWNIDHFSRLRAFLRFSSTEQVMALQRKIRIAAKRIKRFLSDRRSQPSGSANRAAGNGHGGDLIPRIYRGNVTVFRVYEQQYYRLRDEQLGWGRRALGEVDVHFIPGEHLTIFREPHVHALARNLSDCIQKALASN